MFSSSKPQSLIASLTATPNEVDNNLKSQKLGLINLNPKVTMYLKTKSIGKKLGPRDNLVSKNPKYVNDVMKPINLR
jgi:hypothetical protein